MPENIAAQQLAALQSQQPQQTGLGLLAQVASPARQRLIEKESETKFRGGPLSLIANAFTKDRRAGEAADRQQVAAESLQREEMLFQQSQDDRLSAQLQAVRAAGRAQNQFKFEVAKATNAEERSLRNTYQAAVKPAVDVLRSVDLARSQLKLGGPEAALNSARIFIQQLDKSMITNPEIANLLNQQGLSGQVDAVMNWAAGKGKFDDATRNRMVDSMAAIGSVYEQHAQGIVEDMTGVVENNALPLTLSNVITMGGFANKDFDLSQSGTEFTPPTAEELQSLSPPGITPVQ